MHIVKFYWQIPRKLTNQMPHPSHGFRVSTAKKKIKRLKDYPTSGKLIDKNDFTTICYQLIYGCGSTSISSSVVVCPVHETSLSFCEE
jgi:hypothetical protein